MIDRLLPMFFAAALCAPIAASAQRIVSLLDASSAPVVVDPATHRALFAMTNQSLDVFEGTQKVANPGAGVDVLSMILDSSHQRLYMMQRGGGLVILNVTNWEALAEVSGITGAMAVNERTQRLYVLAGSQIVVLDGANGQRLGTIALPGGACSMALNPDTNQFYVAICSQSLSGAAVVDLDTSAVTFIPVPEPLPAVVAVNRATNRAYVIDNDGGTAITVIDGSTKQYHYLHAGATGTGKPSWIGVDPSGNRIYARFGNQYFVIDAATEAVVARMDGTNTALDGSISEIKIDPAMNRLYVLVDQNTLVALDASTLAIVTHQPLPVNERSMDLDVAMHRLYTAGAGGLLIDTSAAPGPPMNNYEGLWWNPNESGWGVNISQQGDVWFAAWYTYDHDGKPTWFVMPRGSRTTGETFSGTLYRSTAGSSYQTQAFDSSSVVATPVGTMTFSFTDANTGTMVADVNGTRIAKAITREQLAAPGLVCQTGIGATAQNFTDLWWNWPAGSQSGWGLFVTQQSNTAFSVWFTYDVGGQPTWFATTSTRNTSLTSMTELNGDVYQTTGPAFDAPSWDASRVQPTRVGTMRTSFTDVNQGAFSFTIGSVSSSRAITRERFASLASACR